MAKAKWTKTQYPGIYSYETQSGTLYGIRVRYQDNNFKWCEKNESGFTTIKKARARKTDLENTINNGSISNFDADKMTFKEWYEKYREIKSPHWTPDTLANVESFYKNHYVEFYNVPLSKITLTRYQKFINQKLNDDNLGLKSVESIHKQFKAIINAAVNHDILPSNKIDSVIIKKTYAPTNKLIEENDLMLLDRFVKLTYNDLEYGMYVLMRIGWRRGEIMGFTKQAFKKIDESTVEISVIMTRTEHSDGGKVPKTDSSYRTNRLTGDKAKAIMNAISASEELHKAFGKEFTSDTFVFVNSKTCVPIYGNYLKRILDRTADKIGIRTTPHMYRHTFASIAISDGQSPVEVAKWLGHANISMTLNTYSHSTENAFNKLAKFASD